MRDLRQISSMSLLLGFVFGELHSIGCARAEDTIKTLLAAPLTCNFQAISVGQFRGLDYAPGVPSGTSVVMIAVSPEDLRQGRAALIERERAAIAQVVLTNKQILFLGATPDGDTASLTLFLTARTRDGFPASLTRHTVVGQVPVLAQSTGLCRVAAVGSRR